MAGGDGQLCGAGNRFAAAAADVDSGGADTKNRRGELSPGVAGGWRQPLLSPAVRALKPGNGAGRRMRGRALLPLPFPPFRHREKGGKPDNGSGSFTYGHVPCPRSGGKVRNTAARCRVARARAPKRRARMQDGAAQPPERAARLPEPAASWPDEAGRLQESSARHSGCPARWLKRPVEVLNGPARWQDRPARTHP